MKPLIVVIDNLVPEDAAMLQALYSRSPASVVEHLDKVTKAGSGKFMDTYYVGYGHASIGDCGTTAVFVENVTMLAAKAIQDWPLYSGQEASTRYMDFSKAVFENPAGTPEGEAIQERWRRFYIEALPKVQLSLIQRYPKQDGEDEKVYVRAIAARCFDVMRAFLPAGAHTNLSWTTNLRQAGDKLHWLSAHPDPSIARLGVDIERVLVSHYGHSFRDDSPDGIAFRSASMLDGYFLGPSEATRPEGSIRFTVDMDMVRSHRALFASRPRGVELPHWLAEVGTIQSEFLLDFGSFRDLQRHRNGTIRMPMLTTRLGFHGWYLSELPDDVRHEAATLLDEQARAIEALKLDPVIAQSYVAMGYLVGCRVTQSLPAFVYRLELRSSKTVHPTLRWIVRREAHWFRNRFPEIPLHTDDDPDSWTIRRGKQTIEEKA